LIWECSTGVIKVETVPDPRVVAPTDAIVRGELTCICGSDIWYYRGTQPTEVGQRTGHEFVGEVVAVGRGGTGP
jgi:threonine dehydrogenase-like Zn-dependent dehydrogenase